MKSRFEEIDSFLKDIDIEVSDKKKDDTDIKLEIYDKLKNYGLTAEEKKKIGNIREMQSKLYYKNVRGRHYRF